jgi:SAM-dependent methyltransferase
MKHRAAAPRSAPSAYWLEGFARLADQAADSESVEQTQAWYKALLAPYVPTHAGMLLDVGCGRGSVIAALAALAPEARRIGIDGSEVTLAAAKRELAAAALEAELYVVDVTAPSFERQLPADCGRFDVITSFFALHHYPPHKAGTILRGLRTLLAPSGILVLAESHDPAAQDAAMSERVCAELAALAGEMPDMLWTEAELREACRLGGFADRQARLVAGTSWPFTPTEAAANRQALDRLWQGVQAAEKLAPFASVEQVGALKRIVATMCEFGIARPARFAPLLAILSANDGQSPGR